MILLSKWLTLSPPALCTGLFDKILSKIWIRSPKLLLSVLLFFRKKKSRFSSFSESRIVTSKVKKLWTFFYDLWLSVDLFEVDKAKLKFTKKLKLLLWWSLMRTLRWKILSSRNDTWPRARRNTSIKTKKMFYFLDRSIFDN